MRSRRVRSTARSAELRVCACLLALGGIASCGIEVDTIAYATAPQASGGAAHSLGGSGGAAQGGSGGVTNEGGRVGSEPRGGDLNIAGGEAGAPGGASGAGSGGEGGAMPVGCVGGYPRIAWTSSNGARVSRCVAGFARDRMNHALCSRGVLDTPGRVYTDAFDSSTQSSASGAAAVGVNGDFLGQLSPIIFGGLAIGSRNLLLLPGLDVHGDLRLRGSLRTSGPIYVGRDAWFAESVVSLTSARVERDVHLAPGKTLDGFFSDDVGGRVTREAFEVPSPCGGSADNLDIAGIVSSAAGDNENSFIGLASETLLAPSQAVDLRLGCGRFYLSGIGGSRDIRLRVTNRAALFVAGDVASSGRFDVSFAPGAELDWFIGGNLALSNIGTLGDATTPAALRIYVAGRGAISLPRDPVFGNVYAPNADVALTGIGDFHGSISAANLTSLANIIVHYDAAVQNVSNACRDEPVTVCSGCGECESGETCTASGCAPCASDADCCLPLICDAGRCSAFVE